jgi:DNA-binding transcriptional MerR regulator
MLFEALTALVDRGIALIKEGESRRANFLREIVEPIHKTFYQFRDEHMATFAEIRTMLRNPSVSLEQISEFLNDRESRERNSWLKFGRLEELGCNSRARLGEQYYAYLAELRKCLVELNPNANSLYHVQSITFYHTLQGRLTLAVGRALQAQRDAASDGEAESRKQVIKQLESITAAFQQYCTNVEMAYLRLREHSLV